MLYKILFVDDETAYLRLLERLFRGKYEIFTASSGDDAVGLLEQHDIALIICDQRMPGMTGIEFLKKAAEMRPQTVRIMLTGYTDAEALVEAINSGVVYKYITKPWINDDLKNTVKRALQHYETMKAQRQLQLQNERLQARLREMRDAIVTLIGDMLETKDAHALGHAERTRDMAIQIGKNLKLDPAELDKLGLAAFLHEVAAFRIPNHILYKATPLSETERQIIEQSFELGLQMLENIPEFEEVASLLRFNFENYDGSGFPAGYAYDQIPLKARIIAVANAYDSFVSPCSGDKVRLSHFEAIDRLRRESGNRFDPTVVDALTEQYLNIPNEKITPEPVFA